METYANPDVEGSESQESFNNEGDVVNAESQPNGQQDWESQAKYHQSEKDKLYEENKKNKSTINQFRDVLSKPGVVDAIKGAMSGTSGNSTEDVKMTSEEFDPWSAYNDSNSKSYQFRVQQEAKHFNSIADEKLKTAIEPVIRGQVENNLKTTLSAKYKMSEKEIGEFMDFANTPMSNMGEDDMIKMFRAYKRGKRSTNVNPLNQIRKTKSTPQQAGVLQGQSPKQKGAGDELFDRLLGTTEASKLV